MQQMRSDSNSVNLGSNPSSPATRRAKQQPGKSQINNGQNA
jgi:hypothetical protein